MSQTLPPLVKHPIPPLQPVASNGVIQNSASTGAQSFIPRREFIRDHRIASTFALLALSGSGYVRLYSFSQPVIAALKKLFNQHGLLSAVREHAPHHFFEFALEGKPWAKAKTITSEKLIIDIFCRILHCGYIFLSTIDYGREQDDKLAIAFSKPQIVSSSLFPLSNGSAVSLNPPVSRSAVRSDQPAGRRHRSSGSKPACARRIRWSGWAGVAPGSGSAWRDGRVVSAPDQPYAAGQNV